MNCKAFLLISFAMLVFSSCQPPLETLYRRQMILNPTSQDQIEKNRILQYAVDNQMDLKSTDSGIYYNIKDPGDTRQKPGKESLITAHYVGRLLLGGDVFDSSRDRNEPLQFKLDEVIEGWQESIPLLGKGGEGTFIIPSRLAYGDKRTGAIPPNSVLIFDIELIDFENRPEG